MNERLRDLFLMSAEKLDQYAVELHALGLRSAARNAGSLAHSQRVLANLVDASDVAEKLAEAFCQAEMDAETKAMEANHEI